jgi:hypothetical protein
MVAWVFSMQEVGLSISLQQLKMKVAKLTKQGQHLFEKVYQRAFGDTGSRGDILSLTFIKLKDWIIIKHKG